MVVVLLLLVYILVFIAVFSKTVIVTRTCITADRWRMLFIPIAVPIASGSSVAFASIAAGVLIRVRASYLSIFTSAFDALVTVLV